MCQFDFFITGGAEDRSYWRKERHVMHVDTVTPQSREKSFMRFFVFNFHF